MRITDINAGKTSLESILEKKRIQKTGSQSVPSGFRSGRADETDFSKGIGAEQARIRDLGKSYIRNNVSIKGIEDLQKTIHEFEQKPENQRDFAHLSQDLKQIVTAVKHDGENVISYLSTQVKDDKSLYALKSTLSTEAISLRQTSMEERKQIAQFLVKNENLDAVSGFSADAAAQTVVRELSKGKSENLFRGLSNIANLIGSDR